MAVSNKNILITPATNVADPAVPKIVFSGADASTANQDITLNVYPQNGGTLSFEGTNGQLFSINNSVTGTIYSVNDVSGIPSIEVLDTGLIKFAQYSGNVVLGSAVDDGKKFQVTGTSSYSGDSLYKVNARTIYGPNASWSSYLYVGGDGTNGITRTAAIASIVTTNGNMHIDSGTDKSIYLNFYSGTGGVQFCNGAQSIVATVSSAGVFTGNGSGLTNLVGGNVSGTVGSATNAATAVRLNTFGQTADACLPGYGIRTFYQWGGTNIGAAAPTATSSYTVGFTVGDHPSNGAYGWQLAQNMWNNELWFRTRDAYTWRTWYSILHSGNYNGYSPTLTGGGASGNWGINVTGSSASCTGNAENLTSPSGTYKHVGAWAVGRTDPGAILVNTAYIADNADTVDGQHFAWSNNSNSPTYLWAADSNGSSYLAARGAMGVSTATYAYNCNSWFALNGDYGHAIEGIYNSGLFQGVYDMGPAYRLTAGGGVGNLYGMCWSYPSAGGAAANLDSHGMIVLINGGFASCMSYSIKASANVTSYSDERLKTNWKPLADNFVEKLANVKVGTYDRIDQSITQVGVSAQSLETLLPEAVITGNDEMQTKSVAYGNAAMASTVMLAKEMVEMKRIIEELKNEISQMKKERNGTN